MTKKKRRIPQQAPQPVSGVQPTLGAQVPAPVTDPLLLTVSQVCDLLGGISRSTLVRMEKSGKLPGRVQLGGSVRYHRETIEAWLKEIVSSTQPVRS